MEVPKTDRRIAQARQLFDDDVVAGHRYGAASLQDRWTGRHPVLR